jgi:hypothetical protein
MRIGLLLQKENIILLFRVIVTVKTDLNLPKCLLSFENSQKNAKW